MKMISGNKIKILEIVIILFVVSKILYTGILYDPDSLAFTTLQYGRSPGYMLFASFFTSVFGNSFEFPLLLTQLIFNLGICIYVKVELSKLLRLKSIYTLLLLVILLVPLVSTFLTANKILTESLTYPLFLLFNLFALQSLILVNTKYVFKGMLVLILLVITRNQFLAMIPVFLIVNLFMWWRSKRKSYLFLLLATLCIPVLTTIFEKTFNYVAFDTFTSIPGAHMPASSVFFVADEEDYNLFSSDEEVEFFKTAMTALKRKNLLASSLAQTDYYTTFSLYQSQFSKICNQTLHEIAMTQFTDSGKSQKDRLLQAEQLFKSMYWPLLKNNFKKWISLYIQNIRYALGSTKMLFLYLFLFVAGVVILKRNNRDRTGLFLSFTTLCTFCSLFLLALVSHSEYRYLFYHHWTLFVGILLLIHQYLQSFENVNYD